VELHVPPHELCTDNAAMIASAARFGRRLAYPEYLSLDAYATGEQPHEPAPRERPPHDGPARRERLESGR
jgi:hypothetical protein